MLKLKKIAITGGIATGKTSVSNFFKDNGAHVVRADDIAHRLLSPSTLLGKKVIQLLGNTVVEKGQFNRVKIAELVFEDPKKLKRLEEILHPPILQSIENEYDRIKKLGNYKLFIVEIPLLFEIQMESFFDTIIVVNAEQKICKERFIKMGHPPKQYEQRISRHMPIREKIKLADFVIENNGDKNQLKRKVENIFASLEAKPNN